MMTLVGNVGKSVVLESLIKTNTNILAVVYDKEPIDTVEAYYYKQNFNIPEFLDSLREMVEKEHKDMLVVYTNLKEGDVFEIKELVEELEQDGCFRYGIVMCKE